MRWAKEKKAEIKYPRQAFLCEIKEKPVIYTGLSVSVIGSRKPA